LQPKIVLLFIYYAILWTHLQNNYRDALHTSSFYVVCININRLAPARNKSIYHLFEPVWIFNHSHFFSNFVIVNNLQFVKPKFCFYLQHWHQTHF
jgi:hypothetical protein